MENNEITVLATRIKGDVNNHFAQSNVEIDTLEARIKYMDEALLHNPDIKDLPEEDRYRVVELARDMITKECQRV